MLNSSDLIRLQAQSIIECDKSALVDLRGIRVDNKGSVYERVDSFFTQVNNPYLFKVGDVAVKVDCGKGKSFAEALTTGICNG